MSCPPHPHDQVLMRIMELCHQSNPEATYEQEPPGDSHAHLCLRSHWYYIDVMVSTLVLLFLYFLFLPFPLLPNYFLINKEIAIKKTRKQASHVAQCKVRTRIIEIVTAKLLSAYPESDCALRTYKIFFLYTTVYMYRLI